MKRRVFWTIWALLPVFGGFWYFGPGQELLAKDLAASHLDLALEAEGRSEWATAADEFQLALDGVPPTEVATRRYLTLKQSRASFMSGKTWSGIGGMEELLAEISADSSGDQELANSTRYNLATAQFFATPLSRAL